VTTPAANPWDWFVKLMDSELFARVATLVEYVEFVVKAKL